MGRAAHGLARVAAGELRARTGGVVGRRVTLLVGSGDNGGDALWAGALLRRRGVAVTAVLLNPDRAHPAGLAALQAAGGRSRPTRAIPIWCSTASSASPGRRGAAVLRGTDLRTIRGASRSSAPAPRRSSALPPGRSGRLGGQLVGRPHLVGTARTRGR
ncbi:hypothetical protein GTA28_26960 [Rhodococcus hoagii]|nr:hypothetical protein [Prescottella equi]